MKKEDVNLIAQLLIGIKDAVKRLEKACKKKNMEEVAVAKKEILNFQSQINNLL